MKRGAQAIVNYQHGSSKRPRSAVGKDDSGQIVEKLAIHTLAFDGKAMYNTVDMAPAAPTTVLENTQPFSFIIENESVGVAKDAVFRFKLTNDGVTAVRLLPTPLWFDRVEWYDRRTAMEIARYHGDTMYWWLMTAAQSQKKIYADMCNWNPCTGGVSDKKLQPGESRYYYLPAAYLWLNLHNLDISMLKSDLEVKFYPKGNIYAAAETTNFSLSQVSIINESELFTLDSKRMHMSYKMYKSFQTLYVDTQRWEIKKNIYAGQQNVFTLDQFHHDSSMLYIVFRQSKNLGAILEYTSLGRQMTIDHENVHGQSQLGDGTPLEERYARAKIGSALWDNSFVESNAVYVVPFTRDPSAALGGVIDGFHPLKGDRERVVFSPPAVGTDTVTSFTPNAASTAGTFTISYKGCITPDLQWDSTVGALADAVNALPSIRRQRVYATFDDTFDTGLAISITWKEIGGAPYIRTSDSDLMLGFDFSNTTGTASIGAQTVTTEGKEGFPVGLSGTEFIVTIYSVAHKSVEEKRGLLSSIYL
jgi:hypothetical protein